MKAFLIIVPVLFSVKQLHSKDILFLKDGRGVAGHVIDVEPEKIIFQPADKKDEILKLSPEHVGYVRIEKAETLYWIQDSLYKKGISDATIHHKRFGRNFLAGFFGAHWGFIVVALLNPKPPDPQMVGQDNYNNPSYQKGYRKKAKEKNVLNALVGLALISPLVIIILFGGEWSLM